MNERIKELAKRLDFPVGLNDPQWAYENKLYEFAALIVRECADICTARKLTPAEFVASELREYFGIESVSKPEPPAGRVFKEWTFPK